MRVAAPFEIALDSWEPLNAVDPSDLGEARIQSHWAVRVLGAVGEALLPPEPDFSHASLSWHEELGLLVGGATDDGLRVGLGLGDLSLHLLAEQAAIHEAWPLKGHNLDEAISWLKETISNFSGRPLTKSLVLSTEELPDHPVGRGQRFALEDSAPYQELARWYANAARLQSVVSANTMGASPVRCWPHHFDIATLITLDADEPDPQKARAVGFGMTPADTYYDEPYFYVNPWPYPEPQELPPLDGDGLWHTEGWVGGVLPASRINASAKAREQAEQVYVYLRSAMAAGRALLGTL